jgi:hypothetical protein
VPNRPAYWSGTPEQWHLITEIQSLKRQEMGAFGQGAIRSDANVMVNPVTGQDVPIADLQYAKDHLHQIYESGMIREDRWAFLWYH